DAAVIEFMGANPQAGRMLADIRRFIDDWLPCFERDNRSYLTIAIGCTGGRHRSVYFVETLAEHFKEKARVLVRHRELS
ncbi:MAG: RNase adaptor protein RapZ, partial [Betaproteobacteria bacterium]